MKAASVFLLAFLLAVGVGFLDRVAGKTRIELKEVVYLTGRDVYLEDIATFDGEDASHVEALQQVNVGRAPLIGATRRLTIGQIEVRLRQAGIHTSTVEFVGPTQVEIIGQTTQGTQEDATPSASGHLVLVATRTIARGEILSQEDLVFEFRDRPAVTTSFGEIVDYVGKRAVRTLTEGSVVSPAAVEIPPVIERGDRVTIVVRVGLVTVTAPGVARSAGGLGETIPVENSVSGKVVYGLVVSASLVEVVVGGTP